MTADFAFIGTKVQLRLDGEYAATYESIEDAESARDAYLGR
jgi:hypothetical protein